MLGSVERAQTVVWDWLTGSGFSGQISRGRNKGWEMQMNEVKFNVSDNKCKNVVAPLVQKGIYQSTVF